jgi:hypothetical protein
MSNKIKVFRLFEDNLITDWKNRGEPYGKDDINKMTNPDGDQTKTDKLTSIPSPFARMDLVKSAFDYVTSKGKSIEGTTPFHQLVSEALDIGELFFNMDALPNLKIKHWDKKTDLEQIKGSSNPKHHLLANTLELFLNQDATSFNFKDLNKLYFLYVDENIIGSTSPVSLFVSSGNKNLQDLCSGVSFGNYTPFGGEFIPLYKRDPDFQRFLYLLFKKESALIQKLPAFYEYLKINKESLKRHNRDLYEIIIEQESKAVELIKLLFEELNTGTEGDYIEILGIPLRKKKIREQPHVIKEQSDFIIEPSQSVEGLIPMALQNNFKEPINYLNRAVKWDYNQKVPYIDNNPVENRTLPGQLTKYPYLTVSDFLQPYLVQLPYKLNKSYFFDGNTRYENGLQEVSYLIPLHPHFFRYFTVEDLRKPTKDGKPMLEIIAYAATVEVYLRIPIKRKGYYITFKRIYENLNAFTGQQPNLENNQGFIIKKDIGVALYPNIKAVDFEIPNPEYRLMLMEGYLESEKINTDSTLEIYNVNQPELKLKTSEIKRTSRSDGMQTLTEFHALKENFDFINITNRFGANLLIPAWKYYHGGSDEFGFAVDFGTTNTHIEYQVNSDLPTPFEYNETDSGLALTFTNPGDEGEVILVAFYSHLRTEFLTEKLNHSVEINFPMRTALTEMRNLDNLEHAMPLREVNITTHYEKHVGKRNSRVHTNLKWASFSGDTSDNRRIELFFEQLVWMMRNKVLNNGGNLNKTRLVWFYPSSMSGFRKTVIEKAWITTVKKYFGPNASVASMTESEAPFWYLRKQGGVSSQDRPAISIDIGGGTSDIMVFKDGAPILSTSFRFAANAIYSDGYSNSADTNGFVMEFDERIKKLIKEYAILDEVHNEIKKNKISEDIVAFYYSLESDSRLKNDSKEISFSKWLSEHADLKIVFLLFYSAIIYHIANLLKAAKIESPRYISFSGTGSKTLQILDQNSELQHLTILTQHIFKAVYKSEELERLNLMQHSHPKEMTSKGGLFAQIKSKSAVSANDIHHVLLGSKEPELYKASEAPFYEQITNRDTYDEVIEELNSFFDLFFELQSQLNFSTMFGVNPAHMNKYPEAVREDMMQYLKDGFHQKKTELHGKLDIRVEETAFFYALKGILNKLAYKIIKEFKV